MTEKPRITQDQLDNYIDDEETNIDFLFDDVLEELKKSNATKKKAEKLLENYQKEQERLEAMEATQIQATE
jgi:hypothetical protein